MDRDIGRAQYDLHLTIQPTRDASVAIWNYNTDIFERATIERLAEALRNIARSAIAAPHAPQKRIRLLSAAQRAWLLGDLNRTECALGSRRFRIEFRGPGGHSWSAFGTANPVLIRVPRRCPHRSRPPCADFRKS